MRAAALAGLILSAASLPLAADPYLALPIACTPGTDCFIEDYVDADPGPGQRDFTCGLRSRDGHSGTDFALISFAAMAQGVNVLAAAPGTVAATRDGMDDTPVTAGTRAAIAGRECGNAVRIQHDNGDQTLYCHLRRGSIAVAQGDTVAAGDVLGQVGLSGETNYPHLHLTVLRGGARIDPFAPDAVPGTCGTGSGVTLWLDPVPYMPTGFYTAGFSDGVPSLEDVQTGAARRAELAPDAPLVLYGHVFLAEPGDVMTFRIDGPQGKMHSHSELLRDPQKQLFRASGRRAPDGGWPQGIYRGTVTLTRGDTLIGLRHAEVTIQR